VAQKSLTGHPKGAAAAWMFNGCVQAMQYGVVPGNTNLDTVDNGLQKYQHLVYPNRSIKVAKRMNAVMLKSFGFGQAGMLYSRNCLHTN
jgi:fatty acid synthase subunit alpha